MKIKLLKRYSADWGGNKLSAFFGYHTFVYGGKLFRSIHLWPLYIELPEVKL